MECRQLSLDFDQKQQLQRVTSRIGSLVVEYFDSLGVGGQFRADDLRNFIGERLEEFIAPGSPDRIMRDLRQRGVINYAVRNRRESLYEKLAVG